MLGCHESKLSRGREVGTERFWKTLRVVGWVQVVSRQHQAGIWVFHLPLLPAHLALRSLWAREKNLTLKASLFRILSAGCMQRALIPMTALRGRYTSSILQMRKLRPERMRDSLDVTGLGRKTVRI